MRLRRSGRARAPAAHITPLPPNAPDQRLPPRTASAGSREIGTCLNHMPGRARVAPADRSMPEPRFWPPANRGVIFAEVVPLGGVEQAHVKRFQHVNLNVAQTKAPCLPGNAEDQVSSIGGFENPVEEIALNSPLDADFVECLSGELSHRRRRPEGRARSAPRSSWRRSSIGVLQEQRVVADFGAIGLAQQPVPQLPL